MNINIFSRMTSSHFVIEESVFQLIDFGCSIFFYNLNIFVKICSLFKYTEVRSMKK